MDCLSTDKNLQIYEELTFEISYQLVLKLGWKIQVSCVIHSL